MHIKTAPRTRLLSSTSMNLMLRGPQVFYAPDEEGGGEAEPVDDTPEEFREQPGDREPDEALDDKADREQREDSEEPEVDPEAEPEEEEPAEEPTEAVAEPEAPQPKKDWKDRQIAKLREREKAKDTELAELRQAKEAAEALLAATPEEREKALGGKTEAEIRQQVQQELTQQNYFKRLSDGLDAMDASGKKEFQDGWEDRVVQAADALGDEMRKNPDFLEALTDLPNSSAVYYELTGDLDRMESILKMPAHKMGMELARLSDSVAKPRPKPVSKAPPPIKPLDRPGGERTLEELLNDPRADMAEIDRRMAAEEKKRAKAH